VLFPEQMRLVEQVAKEAAERVARVAALDTGKAEMATCMRAPYELGPAGPPKACWTQRSGS
jgi:hypothetical protein